MSTLLDTNIVTRLVQPSHPQHQAAFSRLGMLRNQGEQLYLVPQVLYEFWVVVTRPTSQNGLGFPPANASQELTQLKRLFALAQDTPAISAEWERLVSHHQVVGKNAHDARLVAAMTVHGITQLLTFNAKDFQRYPGIVVITP